MVVVVIPFLVGYFHGVSTCDVVVQVAGLEIVGKVVAAVQSADSKRIDKRFILLVILLVNMLHYRRQRYCFFFRYAIVLVNFGN